MVPFPGARASCPQRAEGLRLFERAPCLRSRGNPRGKSGSIAQATVRRDFRAACDGDGSARMPARRLEIEELRPMREIELRMTHHQFGGPR